MQDANKAALKAGKDLPFQGILQLAKVGSDYAYFVCLSTLIVRLSTYMFVYPHLFCVPVHTYCRQMSCLYMLIQANVSCLIVCD
jgi:hypothetical protein